MTSPKLTPQMLANLCTHLYREGATAYQQKDFTKSLIWFSQCLDVCRQLKNTDGMVGRVLFFIGAIYSHLKSVEQMMAFCEASVSILQQQPPESGDGERLTLIGAVCFHNGNPTLAYHAFKTALRFFKLLNQPADVKVAQEQLNKLGKMPPYQFQSREFIIRLDEQPVCRFEVATDGKVRWSSFSGLDRNIPIGSRFPWNTVCANTQADVPRDQMDNLSKITSALSALTQRRYESAFVIFEEKRSGKFVQFSGLTGEGLLLDLPLQSLTKKEIKRAKALFQKLGLSGPKTSTLYTDKSLRVAAGTVTAFRTDFGHDYRRAAEVTAMIFKHVFRFRPDFQLLIEEN